MTNTDPTILVRIELGDEFTGGSAVELHVDDEHPALPYSVHWSDGALNHHANLAAARQDISDGTRNWADACRASDDPATQADAAFWDEVSARYAKA